MLLEPDHAQLQPVGLGELLHPLPGHSLAGVVVRKAIRVVAVPVKQAEPDRDRADGGQNQESQTQEVIQDLFSDKMGNHVSLFGGSRLFNVEWLIANGYCPIAMPYLTSYRSIATNAPQ